jgi:hypothetical protein
LSPDHGVEESCRSDCLGYDVSGCKAGGTVEALGCSQQDVRAAIDAASDGDTDPDCDCSEDGTCNSLCMSEDPDCPHEGPD